MTGIMMSALSKSRYTFRSINRNVSTVVYTYVQSRESNEMRRSITGTRQGKQHIIISAKPNTAIQQRQARRFGTPTGGHAYHRRAAVVCCIKPGEIDDGGLAMRLPVEGLTIGMALLRERIADG